MEENNFNIAERLTSYESSKAMRNSKAYKLLETNHVDTNELLGIDKDPLAGSYPIKDKDPVIQKAKEESFMDGLFELGENLKNSDVATSIKSRVPEGLINVADFGTNIFNSFDRLFSLDPNYQSTDIFNKWSANLDKARNSYKEKRKDVEGSISDMAGMVLQDAPYAAALYPVFNKFMSKGKAAALAFGVGYGIAFEEDKNIFLPSEAITKLKHLINILPDNPEDQIADDVIQAFEGTALAALIPGVVKAFQFMKRRLPTKEVVSDLSKIGASAAVIAGASTKAKSKEKPVIDVSKKQLMKN